VRDNPVVDLVRQVDVAGAGGSQRYSQPRHQVDHKLPVGFRDQLGELFWLVADIRRWKEEINAVGATSDPGFYLRQFDLKLLRSKGGSCPAPPVPPPY